MAEIIFGIDHGNGNMKGENVCFPCGLVRYVSEPGRFMNEDILEYQGTYYTLSDTKMPFKADKTVDDDYFILTLYALAMEARNKGITLTGKDVVLGVGLPPADYGQQATSFKKYFLDHAKHGISFKMNGKSVNFYLKDVFVSPQNFAAVMCFKASLLKKYRTVNCIDIGDGTVDLLVIRNGKPDLSVRVSDRSGMAVLRSEISNAIQQNYGIHLDSSDVEQVLMQEETILDLLVSALRYVDEDFQLRIVGNGTDKEIEELKTRIKNANLLGKVEFCGFKQGKDLLEEYQYASVFVLPTREDCFGLVLLEAACTGTPIVTSKYADGAYDIITENVNGSIIDPYNAEEFGKTIESILRNPEKYRADKKIFDKFSFESVSKGYVDAIEYTLKDN